jgi:hypothetical protein
MFFVNARSHRTFRASYQSIAFSQLLEGLGR